MRRLCLAVLTVLAGCHSPEFLLWQAEQEKYASGGGDSSGDAEDTTSGPAEPASSGTVGSESADLSTTDAADTTGMESPTDTGDATDTDDDAVLNPDRPKIVTIELPPNAYAAGPLPLTVQTEHTGHVRVTRDGEDMGEWTDAGGGLFTGVLPVHGAIDNGPHAVEVIATLGPYEHRLPAMYEVATPDPGTPAWSSAGSAGSRTNRVAVTPAGDVIEVGQTLIGGLPRPTIRKRSGTDGAELWPEKTITLDTREGAVVDVAVRPDGAMWVAMNVREPNKSTQPRIVLLDADGHATGIDIVGTIGGVRAIAVDADGGCFAVGVAGVMGDWDIAYWRVTAAGVPTLEDHYDYIPQFKDPHSFVDIAMDVVIDGDVAWMVGMSQGKHNDDEDAAKYLRGILVPKNLHTGKAAGSAIVAPPRALWPQSAFFGAALHPEGVVVTGYGCDETCSKHRIETSRYSVDGTRTWFTTDATNSGLAYGSDVALDSQGRALVAGAVTQNGTLRGYVFGREVGEDKGPILFDHWYPGVGSSEALGIVRDTFDRIFPAGYSTVDGEAQKWRGEAARRRVGLTRAERDYTSSGA